MSETTKQSPPPYCLSWDELHRDTRALAHQLIATGTQWKGIIAIARGGLVPAAILARELEIRLIDTICIASYTHDKQGKPEIVKTVMGDGDGFLLVDDLVDSGVTARIARELLPRAELATVYAKPNGKSAADYWQREFAQDIWIHFPWDIQHQYVAPLLTQRSSATE